MTIQSRRDRPQLSVRTRSCRPDGATTARDTKRTLPGKNQLRKIPVDNCEQLGRRAEFASRFAQKSLSIARTIRRPALQNKPRQQFARRRTKGFCTPHRDFPRHKQFVTHAGPTRYDRSPKNPECKTLQTPTFKPFCTAIAKAQQPKLTPND